MLEKGDFFGEMAMLEGGSPRSATAEVVVEGQVTSIVISGEMSGT